MALTSLEKLATLKPAFGADGAITAGNASPVTDGAAAVLLMSEERARREGRKPLAFIEAIDYAALHPDEGLLMAPAIAVPRLLARTGLKLADIDLIEIHEAFAAQVLANAAAWERRWKGAATGPLDWSRVNVNGSTVAIGHPWSATSGRTLTRLANEMRGATRAMAWSASAPPALWLGRSCCRGAKARRPPRRGMHRPPARRFVSDLTQPVRLVAGRQPSLSTIAIGRLIDG